MDISCHMKTIRGIILKLLGRNTQLGLIESPSCSLQEELGWICRAALKLDSGARRGGLDPGHVEPNIYIFYCVNRSDLPSPCHESDTRLSLKC